MPEEPHLPISSHPIFDPTRPTKPVREKRFWNPFTAIVLAVVLFVGAQLLASVPFILYARAHHWSNGQANTWLSGTFPQFWFVLVVEALTFGGIWWLTRLGGLRLKDIGWKRFSGWDIAFALGGFATYFVVFAILMAVASQFVPDLNLKQQQDIGFQQVHGSWQLAATFVSLVVLPPLTEETFFRGFLFTSFRRRMGLVLSILLTSVLFAIPHLLESDTPGSLLWVAGIDTFVLSIVLCFLREKTGSLWPGILLHSLKNGIAFVALFIAPLLHWTT